MTVYQQDKHTGKVESSFLSPWIGNPIKQVQQAGGNAGEQDVAYAALLTLEVPKGGCGEGGWGTLQPTEAHPCNVSGPPEKGYSAGHLPGSSSPRNPFSQG